MQILKGYNLKELPIVGLEKVSDLMEYDGPLLSHFTDEDKNYLKSLTTIKVPVMDIFGALDLDAVIETADKKLEVARKAGNKNYTQIKVEGADHFFNGKQDVLVKRIHGWIKTYEVK